MTHEQRQQCFYSMRELHRLLCEWRATSDDVKRAVIQDAIIALKAVPLPDDLAAAETKGFSEAEADKKTSEGEHNG